MLVLVSNWENVLGQKCPETGSKSGISEKKIEYLTKRNKIQFSIDFFFSVRPHTEVLFILEIFLKRKRRNNYAFVQTLLYKIRTEFTNINFIQCRLSR